MTATSSVKACNVCGAEKMFAEFSKNKLCRDGVTGECRACHQKRKQRERAARRAHYNAKDRENRQKKAFTYLVYNQLYKLANPDWRIGVDRAEERRKWRQRYPELAARKARENAAKEILTLSDSYIRLVLRGGRARQGHELIPPALIAAKRAHIQVTRQLSTKAVLP